jgi:hypothetical protein
MEMEPLNALNEEMYVDLMTMIKIIMLMNILLVAAGFAIYLGGLVRLYFEDTRLEPNGSECAKRQRKIRAITDRPARANHNLDDSLFPSCQPSES